MNSPGNNKGKKQAIKSDLEYDDNCAEKIHECSEIFPRCFILGVGIALGLLVSFGYHLFVNNILDAEISYEPYYLEMNVTSGDNPTFHGAIKNIGSKDVNVRCSVEGLDRIAIGIDLPSPKIKKTTTTPINISVNTTNAAPGDYKGLFYIWNNNHKNSQDVLERIPLTIQVKNSSKIIQAKGQTHT